MENENPVFNKYDVGRRPKPYEEQPEYIDTNPIVSVFNNIKNENKKQPFSDKSSPPYAETKLPSRLSKDDIGFPVQAKLAVRAEGNSSAPNKPNIIDRISSALPSVFGQGSMNPTSNFISGLLPERRSKKLDRKPSSTFANPKTEYVTMPSAPQNSPSTENGNINPNSPENLKGEKNENSIPETLVGDLLNIINSITQQPSSSSANPSKRVDDLYPPSTFPRENQGLDRQPSVPPQFTNTKLSNNDQNLDELIRIISKIVEKVDDSNSLSVDFTESDSTRVGANPELANQIPEKKFGEKSTKLDKKSEPSFEEVLAELDQKLPPEEKDPELQNIILPPKQEQYTSLDQCSVQVITYEDGTKETIHPFSLIRGRCYYYNKKGELINDRLEIVNGFDKD